MVMKKWYSAGLHQKRKYLWVIYCSASNFEESPHVVMKHWYFAAKKEIFMSYISFSFKFWGESESGLNNSKFSPQLYLSYSHISENITTPNHHPKLMFRGIQIWNYNIQIHTVAHDIIIFLFQPHFGKM